MDDQSFVQQILNHDSIARERFIERYSDAILRGLIRKCQPNCFRRGCPMRFGLTQRNLERTRCDELLDLYVFSFESLIKSLKWYSSGQSLDDWVRQQTDPNGMPFRQRFAAYMATKYPLTGRARIPDRFQHRWSPTQKRIYQEWLRQRTVSETAVKVKLPEPEVMSIMEEILEQLSETCLLESLKERAQLEAFQQRERRIFESDSTRSQTQPSDSDEQLDSSELLKNVPQTQVDVSDRLLVQALQQGVARALFDLSPLERRLLALKFDLEWTLQDIAQQGDSLGLGKMTNKQAGHAIDNILRKMLSTINRELAAVEDVNLQLPELKRVLLEWGTETSG